jgi:hypothetical protein
MLVSVFGSMSLDNSSDVYFQMGVRELANAVEARPAFRKAADGYKEEWLFTRTRESALAWGRASFLAGDVSEAIAAFRSGLKRYPADPELQRGWRHCRAKLGNEVGPNDLTEEWRARISPNQRLGFTALAMMIFSLGIWSRFTIRHRLTWPVILLGSLGLAAAGLLEWQCQREEARDLAAPVYVVKQDTPLRTGNGESYPPRLGALLPLGTEVREVARRGGWLQVQLESGELGWLPEGMLVKVD